MVEVKDVQQTIDQINNLIKQLSKQCEQLNTNCQDKEELKKIKQLIKKLETDLTEIFPNQKCSIAISQNGSLSKIDKLKKRAQRFGCVSSTEIKKIMDNEALLKRKQKFNEVSFGKDNENVTKINLTKFDPDEAKRKRLERFAAHI